MMRVVIVAAAALLVELRVCLFVPRLSWDTSAVVCMFAAVLLLKLEHAAAGLVFEQQLG